MWNKEISEKPDVADVLLANKFLAMMSRQKLVCSICEGTAWNVTSVDRFYAIVEMDGASEFRTKSMNVLMIVCSGCGYVHLFAKDKVKAVVESSLSSGEPVAEQSDPNRSPQPVVAPGEGETGK